MIQPRLTLSLLLLIAAVLLAAGYIEQNSDVPVEFSTNTHVIAKGAGSAADLAASGISNPEKLNLPEGVGRYDLVTFNIPAIQEKLKAGKDIPIRIRGKEYLANITHTDSKKSYDGIISYGGKFFGEKDFNLGITVGPDVIRGYVQLNGEYFWIDRAEKNARPEYNTSPLHYIYSMNDVGPFHAWIPSEIRHPLNYIYHITPFGHEGGLCGGEFEVYEVTGNQVPNGTHTILTEDDFSAFPELDSVIRGGKNTKATCSEVMDLYPDCIGGGHFKCHEEALVGKYANKYLVYGAKYYYLQITVIS